MAKKKTQVATKSKSRTPKNNGEHHQTVLLANVVKEVGSEALVADKLGCSQQSVSAWLHGTNFPRAPMQVKMKKLWGIPTPWTKPGAPA